MFYFIGNLMLQAMCSRNILYLNLHPIFYKKILKKEISFNEIETLDKLSFDYINSLEAIKDEKEFNEKYPNLFFTVRSSSDNSLIEVIKDGRYKKVTYETLKEYVKLYKEFLITEIDDQVSFISKGIFDILDEKLLSILTPEELEEYISGSSDLNLKLLRERTVYENYQEDSPTIVNFWKALESFTKEERKKYFNFIAKMPRIPNLENKNLYQTISKLTGKDVDQDQIFPTANFYTLSLYLPDYSSYEILRDKLLFAINIELP